MKHSLVKHIDWISVLLYLCLVSCGWIAIFSTTYSDLTMSSIFDLNQFYGKQMLFIGLSFILIAFILALDSKLYVNLAIPFYIVAILLLAGLFVFGKDKQNASVSNEHMRTLTITIGRTMKLRSTSTADPHT